MSDCITWKEGDIAWDNTDFTWSEICLLIEVITQGGGYSEQFKRLRDKDKKTQKKFIKLLCKIKDEEYEETKYFRPDIRVRAGDFKLIERFLEKPEISIFINKDK
jgi:mRNA-degrading endonuclease RelE of RelBE toxin-antitoxin system